MFVLVQIEKDDSSTITQDVETGIIRGGKKPTKLFGLFSPILLQAFTLTFLAEWGDRSQLATILLASREVSLTISFFVIKTEPAQSSNNECKNYLPKIYSQHIKFLYTIEKLSLCFISLCDPAMKSPNILKKFKAKPRKNASRVCYCVFN